MQQSRGRYVCKSHWLRFMINFKLANMSSAIQRFQSEFELRSTVRFGFAVVLSESRQFSSFLKTQRAKYIWYKVEKEIQV